MKKRRVYFFRVITFSFFTRPWKWRVFLCVIGLWIWSSVQNTSGGTCFHPNSLMSSYLVNWWKNVFLKFWYFSCFWPFLHMFSLLKIAVNNNSAIFTNILHMKNIWVLPNNKEYVASWQKEYIPGCLVILKCFSNVKRL